MHLVATLKIKGSVRTFSLTADAIQRVLMSIFRPEQSEHQNEPVWELISGLCFSVELHCAALTLVSQVVVELVNSNLQVSLLHLQAGLSIM